MSQRPISSSDFKMLWKGSRIKNYKLKRILTNGDIVSSVELNDLRYGREVRGIVSSSVCEGLFFHWPNLQHQSLAPLLDILYLKGTISIFLSPSPKTSLRNFIHEPSFANQQGSFERKKSYAKDIFSGLEYLHGKCLCLMNLSDANICIFNPSDKAVIYDLSCLVLTTRATKSKFVVPTLYRPPELISESLLADDGRFDAVAAEMWASGVLMLEVFLQHMTPWALIDYRPQRIMEIVEGLELELFQKANATSGLSLDDLRHFKTFLGCFFKAVPKFRISSRNASIAKFLRPLKFKNNEFGAKNPKPKVTGKAGSEFEDVNIPVDYFEPHFEHNSLENSFVKHGSEGEACRRAFICGNHAVRKKENREIILDVRNLQSFTAESKFNRFNEETISDSDSRRNLTWSGAQIQPPFGTNIYNNQHLPKNCDHSSHMKACCAVNKSQMQDTAMNCSKVLYSNTSDRLDNCCVGSNNPSRTEPQTGGLLPSEKSQNSENQPPLPPQWGKCNSDSKIDSIETRQRSDGLLQKSAPCLDVSVSKQKRMLLPDKSRQNICSRNPRSGSHESGYPISERSNVNSSQISENDDTILVGRFTPTACGQFPAPNITKIEKHQSHYSRKHFPNHTSNLFKRHRLRSPPNFQVKQSSAREKSSSDMMTQHPKEPLLQCSFFTLFDSAWLVSPDPCASSPNTALDWSFHNQEAVGRHLSKRNSYQKAISHGLDPYEADNSDHLQAECVDFRRPVEISPIGTTSHDTLIAHEKGSTKGYHTEQKAKRNPKCRRPHSLPRGKLTEPLETLVGDLSPELLRSGASQNAENIPVPVSRKSRKVRKSIIRSLCPGLHPRGSRAATLNPKLTPYM